MDGTRAGRRHALAATADSDHWTPLVQHEASLPQGSGAYLTSSTGSREEIMDGQRVVLCAPLVISQSWNSTKLDRCQSLCVSNVLT